MPSFNLDPQTAVALRAAAQRRGLTVAQYVKYLHELSCGDHLDHLIVIISSVVAVGPDHCQIAALSALLTYLVEVKVRLGFR
jgi:hypothetical protein